MPSPGSEQILKWLFFCNLFLVSLRNAVSNGDQQKPKEDSFIIAGYLPEYRFYININNTAASLTDLILFSLAPDNHGKLSSCCLESQHFEQARQARAYRKEQFPEKEPLKLWMSIGGAGRSNSYSTVAADPRLRKIFVQKLKEKCQKEEMDGVDFDWEAPQNRDDYESYFRLIQHAYEELTIKAGISISVALHPGQIFPNVFYDHVSRINLMTYDMITREGGHHASMDKMTEAIKSVVKAGCPESKLVVGIPAYGRHGKDPYKVQTYSEVVDAITSTSPNTVLKDLARQQTWKGIHFDSPNNVREKVRYAEKRKMGGIFFWEIGQDKQHDKWGPGGMLLEAAAEQAGSTMSTVKSEL